MNGLTMGSRKKSKSIWKQMKMITQQPKTYGTQHTKSVLRGKFIALQTHLKKIEKSQINNLTLHLQEPEEQQQRPERVEGRKKIKIRAELNDIETKKIIQKINEVIPRSSIIKISYF